MKIQARLTNGQPGVAPEPTPKPRSRAIPQLVEEWVCDYVSLDDLVARIRKPAGEITRFNSIAAGAEDELPELYEYCE